MNSRNRDAACVSRRRRRDGPPDRRAVEGESPACRSRVHSASGHLDFSHPLTAECKSSSRPNQNRRRNSPPRFSDQNSRPPGAGINLRSPDVRVVRSKKTRHPSGAAWREHLIENRRGSAASTSSGESGNREHSQNSGGRHGVDRPGDLVGVDREADLRELDHANA